VKPTAYCDPVVVFCASSLGALLPLSLSCLFFLSCYSPSDADIFICPVSFIDTSHVKNPLMSTLYDRFSFGLIPLMGELVAKDRASYQYLVESIRQFPHQDAFLEMIQLAGFRLASYEDLTFGVVAIHSGFKL
jgi:hypothetical protein